jgi:hypothetical protein
MQTLLSAAAENNCIWNQQFSLHGYFPLEDIVEVVSLG